MLVTTFTGDAGTTYGAAWPSGTSLYGSSFTLRRLEVSLVSGTGLLQLSYSSAYYPEDAEVVQPVNTTTHGPLPSGSLGLDIFSTEEDVGDPLLTYAVSSGSPLIVRPEGELSGYTLRWTVQSEGGPVNGPIFNLYLDL
jgi:hypothetical protein